MPTARSQSLSLVLHVLSIALLLILTSNSFRTPPRPPVARTATTVLAAPPRFIMHVTEARGGGSNTSPAPARRGLPPPKSTRIFIPPVTHPEPKLAIMPAIDFDVPVMNVVSAHFGDPLSGLPKGAIGDKGGHRIGNVPEGSSIGDGLHGKAGLGGSIRPADLIYRVEPEFSEEARKARFQGMVVLMIEIGTDGRAHNARMVEDPGLGLGQKAIEAVAQWRFRPAQRNNTAIVTTARVEVYFHLM